MCRRNGIATAALVGGVVVWTACGSRSSPEEAQGEQAPPKAAAPRLIGTASCSARGCHGALGPASRPADGAAVLQDEYGRWLANDKHAQAYAVLFRAKSWEISRHLYGSPAAHQHARCH